MKKIIIDTDLGDDIDDIWALMLVVASSYFDIKLISITNGDVEYKTKVVAKILQMLNRTDIALAQGISTPTNTTNPQAEFIANFSLDSYLGKIYPNYFEAYHDVLEESGELTILAIAPYTSLASIITLLESYNIEIVAMSGSINRGYFGVCHSCIECNIATDIKAAQAILTSKIPYTMLPLDVCNGLIMDGENYQLVKNGKTIYADIINENYDIWQKFYVGGAKKFDSSISSSILYDLAPVWYLLFAQNFTIHDFPILVDEKGYTRIGEGKTITIATEIHMVGPMMKFTAEQLGLEHVGNDELIELGVKGNYSLKYTTSRSNPELSAFECGRQICDPGYYYGPTKREYYILHYIAKGKGIFEINNNKYFLKANDCFLIPPNVTTFYQADKEDPWTYYWVGFNGIGARPICKKAGFIKNDVYALTPLNPKNIEQRIRVLSEIEPRKGSVEYTMLGHLYLLFAEMVSAQEISNSSHRKDDYIAEAIKLMNENYWHDLSVGYIAKFVGLERTYFYRQFKNAMSISPQDYLINMRLTKAMIMLKDTKLRLGEIAMQVGYVNYISFVKVFKKKYGITPKEYRDHPWETN